jgi:hypothetical protein
VLNKFNQLKTKQMKPKNNLSRREFVKKTAASGLAFTIIPSHVLVGSGKIAPSDKLNIALIGCGTQTNAMLGGWLDREELQFTSVCDVNKESLDYPLWGASRGERVGAAGGREVSRRRINEFYAEKLGRENYEGCASYVDFREQLEKETGADAVFIMTSDHSHAAIALAAMKKNLSIATHKPISNFMHETRVTIEAAKKSEVPTHCFFFQDSANSHHIKEMIRKGVIGKVKEYHRWTNRPMWPQGSPYEPEPEIIPPGFDWQLWLGPSTDRPYSKKYTHTVFRGWYEFGGGCLADMGHYGMWVDWRVLDLGMPTVADASSSFTCEIRDFRSTWVTNNLSFPHAATIRFEVPVNGTNDSIDAYWYEGGIRPAPPKELRELNIEMPRDGYMIVGEEGTLWPRGGGQLPLLLGVRNAERRLASVKAPEVELRSANDQMIDAFKGGRPSLGNFENAQTISEAICLGNLAIRMDKRLEWDNQNLRVTNVPEANQYVKRIYRRGWEIG